MRSFLQDENAQAGVIVVFILAIIVFSVAYIAFGKLVDEGVIMHNDLITDFPLSQERADAMDLVLRYWKYTPLIVLLSLVFFAIKESLRERSGEVR